MGEQSVRKLKDKAAQYFEKEQFDEALEVLKVLLDKVPFDIGVLLKIGEVNRLMGQNHAAIDAYTSAALQYAADGMLLKGIAVCKVILEIDPRNQAIASLLQNLYMSQYGALPNSKREKRPPNFKNSLNDSLDIDVDVDLSEIARVNRDALPEIPLLSELDQESFVALLARVPLHHFDAEETIIKEDEIGNSFFILVDGEVAVVHNAKLLATLGPGAFFGEMAVVSPRRRRASVITRTRCEVLEISRPHLDGLLSKCPQIFHVLSQFTEQRLLKNLMATSPLFAPFAPEERVSLMSRFEESKFLKEQTIIEAEQPAEALYLIASGGVTVMQDDMKVATLTEGDIFGEISLLLHSTATATVRAKTNTRLLKLPKGVFNELIMTHPQILELVNEIKDDRLDLQNHRTSLPRNLVSELDGGSALL